LGDLSDLIENIPLEKIEDNPFNARLEYDREGIDSLENSLAKIGQISPIKVRKNQTKYEIVFGHRRIRAARSLGWHSVKAEVCECSDVQMLEYSIVENCARRDLSDYEKGVSFLRVNTEFNKSYEEIGSLVGVTKQRVYHFIRMTNLFDRVALEKDPALKNALQKISERHARVLIQIEDEKTRASVLKLIVTEGLSVRDLERIVNRFRSWFLPAVDVQEGPEQMNPSLKSSVDIQEIETLVANDLGISPLNDSEAFVKMTYDSRYSSFTAFPPSRLYEGAEAIRHEKERFDLFASRPEPRLLDLRVRFWGSFAVATVFAENFHKRKKRIPDKVRGTVVLAKDNGKWKIIHLHYSSMEVEHIDDPPGKDYEKAGSLLNNKSEFPSIRS
jgi:ParB/RepB/Spo0J family partition protein